MNDAIRMMESLISPEAVRRAHAKAEQDILSIHLAQISKEQNVILAEGRDAGIARIDDDTALDEERILTARNAMANEKTYSHEEVWNLLGIPD
ncbi:MAG: hypothetical protein MJZ16_13015 [Bacteroidales bacterium]|nr:hypothetical protein [Bacteroidales bacterium]